MFIPCACDRGVDSIVHTPECGSRRFFCIDGLDHSLLETNTHTQTHTTEHRKNNHDKTRNGRSQVRCDSRVALKLFVCAQECMTNAHGCIGRKRHQRGLGCLRNELVLCSLMEAFANQTWSQFVQRWTVVLASDLLPSDAE
jgi:hypothetical protein